MQHSWMVLEVIQHVSPGKCYILWQFIGPVVIPGDALFNEPVTGGTLVGPGVNATIQGSFAHPSLYNNLSHEVTSIDFYGVTDDKFAFYIHESGVGSSTSKVNRVESCVWGNWLEWGNLTFRLGHEDRKDKSDEVPKAPWGVYIDECELGQEWHYRNSGRILGREPVTMIW